LLSLEKTTVTPGTLNSVSGGALVWAPVRSGLLLVEQSGD
jgi:hypothetical protein